MPFCFHMWELCSCPADQSEWFCKTGKKTCAPQIHMTHTKLCVNADFFLLFLFFYINKSMKIYSLFFIHHVNVFFFFFGLKSSFCINKYAYLNKIKIYEKKNYTISLLQLPLSRKFKSSCCLFCLFLNIQYNQIACTSDFKLKFY